MNQPYSQYRPRTKQALTVGTADKMLTPTDNNLANYGIYGGAGALGGAGIGALMELLSNKKDKSYLKSMLIGGGIGGGLGLGAKALGDFGLRDARLAKAMFRGHEALYQNLLNDLDTSDGLVDSVGDFVTNNFSGLRSDTEERIDSARRNIDNIDNSSALDALLARLNLLS